MDSKILAEKLSRTHSLYIFRGFSSPVDCAQDQLEGRTHYADPDTLRFFKARILSARPVFDGLFYSITESCALDPYNERRGFRVVLFDLFGQVVYRPDLDNCKKTRTAAENAFDEWLETFAPVDYYREAIGNRGASLERQAKALFDIFETQTA